jgi:hypothetical protein
MRALTKREWRAIREALAARLAGPLDFDEDELSPRREDYERALDKVHERLE